MRNFALITALLLCSLSWISVSGSESQPLEVQPGEDVTLLCANFTSSPSQIFWFRVVNRTLPRVVSHIFNSLESAKYSEGFRNGRFVMSSNSSTIFLNIKQVESSDSGLYFCGYYLSQKPVISSASYLQVQVFDGTKLMSVILGSLTVLLLMIVICLAVKIKKLQTAQVEERNPQRSETEGLDDLNYAAVTFRPKTKRNHAPAPEEEEEVEPSAIYSATR